MEQTGCQNPSPEEDLAVILSHRGECPDLAETVIFILTEAATNIRKNLTGKSSPE